MQRRGYVLVPAFHRRAGLAGWAEVALQPVREQPADGRFAVAERHLDAVPVMREVGQPELEVHAAAEPYDAAELVVIDGIAVRREAHRLVLVAVLPHAQVLGYRRVVEAEGVREEDVALDVQVRTAA